MGVAFTTCYRFRCAPACQREQGSICLGHAFHASVVWRARIPRISRLLALALRFESLINEGVVRNYRELAEVGHVSRPRLSQIMQLAQLAPDIQEQVLFLPPTLEGPDRVFESQLRGIARVIDWDKQKELFRTLQETREKARA